MSDKSPLVINIDIKSEDRKCQIIENAVTSILFQVTDTTTRYVYKIHMRGMRNQSETTEGGLKNLELKKECDLPVKTRTETNQVFELTEKHRGNIMLVEFFKYEGVPVLCASCVLIVKPSELRITQVFFKDSTGKEIGCGSVQYRADLKFSLRVVYNRPLLRGEKAPKLQCKGYCTNATTGKYDEISKFSLDENAAYTDTIYCNDGLQESHAGADYVISLGINDSICEPPFYLENTKRLAPSIQKIHLISREARKRQIMSVVWSSKEMIKFGESSTQRKDIDRNEDGFLHIHTRGMYGQKVRVELYEKDSTGIKRLLLGLKNDVTILDNAVCVPIEMSGVYAKAKKGRFFLAEGFSFEIMAKVTPLDTSIAAFEQEDEGIELMVYGKADEDKAAKSTVNGTMKFVIADVEEDEKEEGNKEKKEDMITYHIYAKGHKKEYTVEKHIPKINKYPDTYCYIYHDSSDNEYEICRRKPFEVPKMNNPKAGIVPAKYDKTYEYPSGKGWEGIDAKTAYYVNDENGGLDYVVVKPRKSSKFPIKKYTASKTEKRELIRIPDSDAGTIFEYNNSTANLKFKIKFKQTARLYADPGQFAFFIGVAFELGKDYDSTGCTSKDATGYPSNTHVNGLCFDFCYVDNTTDKKVVEILNKWRPLSLIYVGYGSKTGAHLTSLTNVKQMGGHNSHIHWGARTKDMDTIYSMSVIEVHEK